MIGTPAENFLLFLSILLRIEEALWSLTVAVSAVGVTILVHALMSRLQSNRLGNPYLSPSPNKSNDYGEGPGRPGVEISPKSWLSWLAIRIFG